MRSKANDSLERRIAPRNAVGGVSVGRDERRGNDDDDVVWGAKKIERERKKTVERG